MKLEELLKTTVRVRASDVFIKTGQTPAWRVDGIVRRDILPEDKRPVLTAEMVDDLCREVLRERSLEAFAQTGEADAAYEAEDLGRFRVNVFRQRERTGMVFRHLPHQIPSFEELNLPAKQLRKLCDKRRGLVLITGIAGSGKSTCLASMVDYINERHPCHIVTVEDPIEFVHSDKRALIEQRELGLDTQSFAAALKHVVRQSPDVILIGEMRDQETMEAAINAAETGHLVLSTLHTVNAVQTVERIIGYFPPHLHDLVRMQLAMILEGAISLRLLRRKDKPGRVPAVEVLMATPTVREMLEKGRTRELPSALRDGGYFGTQTFGQSLKKLLDADAISQEDALASADNPEELRLELKGIVRGSDRRNGV